MRLRGLPRHDGLQQATRLGWPGRAEEPPSFNSRAPAVRGDGGECDGAVGLEPGIPGHAILRAVFPMVTGLALVPRRGAGTVMGLGAMLT